jgi:hypothetical protein
MPYRKYLEKLNVSDAARGVHKNGVISTEGFSMLDRSRLGGVDGGWEDCIIRFHVSQAFSNVAWIKDDL